MSKEQTLANEEQKLKSANSLNKLYIYFLFLAGYRGMLFV